MGGEGVGRQKKKKPAGKGGGATRRHFSRLPARVKALAHCSFFPFGPSMRLIFSCWWKNAYIFDPLCWRKEGLGGENASIARQKSRGLSGRRTVAPFPLFFFFFFFFSLAKKKRRRAPSPPRFHSKFSRISPPRGPRQAASYRSAERDWDLTGQGGLRWESTRGST